MNSFKIKENNRIAFSASVQTGFFLLLSLLLILLIAVMIATTVGYDYMIKEINQYISEASTASGTSKILPILLNIDGVAEDILSVINYLNSLEAKAAKVLTFEFIHFVPFILALLVSLTVSASKLKEGINYSESNQKKNYVLDKIIKFISGLIMLSLLVSTIGLPFLFEKMVYKLAAPFFVNLLLILLLYLMLAEKHKTLKNILLSSFIASFGMMISFYVIKYAAKILSFNSASLFVMMFVVFFVFSMVVLPYVISFSRLISNKLLKD